MQRSMVWVWVGVALMGCGAGGEALSGLQAHVEAPGAVEFGAVDVGVPAVADAVFTNTGDGQVWLALRLEGGDGAFEATVQRVAASSGNPAHVPLRFTPSMPGDTHAVLWATREDGNGDAFQVPIHGTGNAWPNCDDGNPCTLDSQDGHAPGGCAHVAAVGTCDDANACTTGDSCQDGACVGQAIQCDDGVACTADACDPLQGCVFMPVPARCDDGDPCSDDVCSPAAGCGHAVKANGSLCGEPSCAALPLCMGGVCTAVTAPDGYPCEDGNACTLGDSCLDAQCVPGPGGGNGPAHPVVVHSGPQAAPVPARTDTAESQAAYNGAVPGAWPTQVVGVGRVESLDPVLGNDVAVAWVGAPQPMLDCVDGPQLTCLPEPSCAAPANVLQLHLSAVLPDGTVRQDAVLRTDTVHVAMAQQLGAYAPPNTTTPPANVTNAELVMVPGVGMVGAAWLHFASQCDCVPAAPPDPNGGAPQDSGAAAPNNCLPAGDALTLLHEDGGALTAVLPGWFGAVSQYAVPVQPPLLDDQGAPLLAVAVDGERLGVVVAMQNTNQDCLDTDVDCAAVGCGCGNDVELRLLSYRLHPTAPAGARITADVEQRVTVAGPLKSLQASWKYGVLTVSMLRTMSVTLPATTCGLPPAGMPSQLLSLDVAFGDEFPATGATPQANLVAGGVVLGQDVLTWTQATSSNNTLDMCMVDDRINLENGALEQPLLAARVSNPTAALSTFRADRVGNRLAVGTMHGNGRLEVLLPGDATSASITAQFEPGTQDAQLSSSAAPRLGAFGTGLVAAQLAQVGLYRNSLPLPAMAIINLECVLP